ncbi:MAG: nucleotide exchange factor GrpE [Acutalibacteraceae bacterium]
MSDNKEKKEKEIKEDEVLEEDSEAEEIKKDLENTKNLLLRTAAEYDNFRKRSEREKDAIYSNAIAAAVKNILPLADSLDAAVKAAENESEEYKKGIDLLSNQMKKAFENLDVESFGEIGDDFDPNLYHAISHSESDDKKQNFVSLVFQKGYKIGDKIIRPSMVQVTN